MKKGVKVVTNGHHDEKPRGGIFAFLCFLRMIAVHIQMLIRVIQFIVNHS